MSDSGTASAGSSRLRRVARPFIWVALALALYAGLGFVVLPLLALHHVPQALGELLGRKLTVDKIGFNPFTLAAEFQGVKIMGREVAGDGDGDGDGGAEGATPALSFDRLMANFEILSLWYGGPVVRELALEGLKIRLTRLDADHYDWSDVFDRLSEPSSEGGGGSPLPYSIANIHVENGLIEVEDRVAGTSHRLSALKLGVPVISSLAVGVDVFIEPSLSAQIDGRPLAAKGTLELKSDGFDAVLEQLSVKDFELAPWLVYAPVAPTFRLPSGTLGMDLRVEFGQHGDERPTFRIQGQAQVNQLVIQDRNGAPALAVAELEVELADVQPLADRYYFSRLRLQQPAIDLVRLADGGINLERLLPASTSTAAPAKAEKEKESPVEFLLSSARIRDGLIRYSDNAIEGGFSSRVEAINLDLRDLSSSSEVPAEIRFDYVTAAGEKFSHQDHLRLKPFSYDGSVTVEGFQAGIYRRYYTPFLPGGEVRNGRVDGTARYRVAAQEGTDEPLVEVDIERLNLSDFVLALNGHKSELLKLNKLVVTDAKILPGTNEFNIEEVNVHGVALAVTRLSGDRYDFMALTAAPRAASRASAAKAPASSAPPWTFRLGKAALEGSSLRFEDRTGTGPMVVTADDIDIQLSELSTAKGAKGASLAVKSRINKGGRLALKGTIVPEPFGAELDLNLQSFGLSVLQPYVLQQAQLGIKGGALSLKGRLTLRQRRDNLFGTLSGDAAVNDFYSTDHRNDADFVRWREFAVKQARIELEPFALSINEIAVDGLRSRLILEQDGRLNLREIQRSQQEALSIAAQGTAESAGDTGSATESATTTATAEVAPASPPPPVRIGRISIRNSNIAFSDRFIRPNYNAFLGNLSGDLTGLSSDQDSLAKLDLQGRVGQSAGLTIKGEFNPFRQDHHLNIEAAVRDFELTDLSGYSGRYIGYGISRGKLSATVNYRVEDRKLSAENHILLDQLTFGDAIESEDATKLPVRLAVSLLKNTRGEIDINLPVSGTLDDPEFSVFGLVLRALAGLIGKAITAPFALLGREELQQMDFAPGSFAIGAEQEEKLRDLAKALEERSSLKLDITGLADAARDTDGLRRSKLRERVRAEQRKSAGGSRNAAAPGVEELSAAEYADLLDDVYDDAKIKKPRNFLGISKNLPVKEMEDLLLANITIAEEDVVALAHRRETSVLRWLTNEGKIAPDRIFQRALTDAEVKDGGRKGDGVRFSLR
jgi:uncharacterized protein involved in outer membrane biogenesis